MLFQIWDSRTISLNDGMLILLQAFCRLRVVSRAYDESLFQF
jgi:hypothetical protein